MGEGKNDGFLVQQCFNIFLYGNGLQCGGGP